MECVVGSIFSDFIFYFQVYRDHLLTSFIHDDEIRNGFFQQDDTRAHTTAETIKCISSKVCMISELPHSLQSRVT